MGWNPVKNVKMFGMCMDVKNVCIFIIFLNFYFLEKILYKVYILTFSHG